MRYCIAREVIATVPRKWSFLLTNRIRRECGLVDPVYAAWLGIVELLKLRNLAWLNTCYRNNNRLRTFRLREKNCRVENSIMDMAAQTILNSVKAGKWVPGSSSSYMVWSDTCKDRYCLKVSSSFCSGTRSRSFFQHLY